LRKQIADSLLDIGHHPGRVSGSREGIGKGLPQGGPFSFFGISFGAVLDNHKWGYHGTYEKESFKQAQTSPFD
jgi:hypothetical protein